MNYENLSESLRIGRRALDGIKCIKIIDDWKWDSKLNKWYIKIEINSNSIGLIPTNSTWYVVVDDNYPKGTVKIYPDASSDFNVTLEHQSNNGLIEENELWRNGSLCLDSPLKCLGKYDFNSEPLNDDCRILWNVKRAVDWIHAANNNKLVEDGDPFELPDFKDTAPYCVFSENEKSFDDWKKCENRSGIVKLDLYKSKPSIFFIKEFKTHNNNTINKVNWGKFLSQKFKEPITGIWAILDKIPVINNWQAPNFLGELIDVCTKQNVDLISIIEDSSIIRDGEHHILLLGFPIPRNKGKENSIVHWQAVRLPILSQIKGKISRSHEIKGRKRNKKASLNSKGFRSIKSSLKKRDKMVLTPKLKLNWLKSQNWSMNEINSRGRLSTDMTAMKTLIIGAGTIGSSIAELLVRCGTIEISIIDSDTLEIGNLSRHSLGLMQIVKFKADEMANYLNQINPHAKVESINTDFELDDDFIQKINKFDLIIDCTSEDIVLNELEQIEFNDNKTFVSICIGFAAKRLYLLLQEERNFNSYNFRQKISPWLEKEKEEFSGCELPREGTGCWSSVFPARYDDILLASSTAIKVIEDFIENSNKELISVYEQYSIDGIFVGYKKVE